MIIVIDDQEVEIDPVTLEVLDSDFMVIDQSIILEGYTRQTLYNSILEPAMQVEPYPCGISQILRASQNVEHIALLCCHHNMYDEVKKLHTKLCSHLSECIPDPTIASERAMLKEAAESLYRTEVTLRNFYSHEHYFSDPDNGNS